MLAPPSIRRSARLALALAVALAPTISLRSAPPAGDDAPEVERTKGWKGPVEGLEELRDKERPALVRYVGRPRGDDAERVAHWLDEDIEKGRHRSALRGFVLIELHPSDLATEWPAPKDEAPVAGPAPRADADRPGRGARGDDDPRSIGKVWRVLPGDPSYLVLDPFEQIARRWPLTRLDDDGEELEPPERREISKELSAIAKQSKARLALVEKVRRTFEASERAFRAGKIGSAVRVVLPYDESEARADLDPATRALVERVIADYRGRAKEKLDAADTSFERMKRDPKNSAKSASDALKAYDEAARLYPFEDVLAHVERQKTAISIFIKQAFGSGAGGGS